MVTWIEWSVSSIFAHATVKFFSETSNWQAVGKTVKRLHLAASCLAMVLLWILAGPIAGLLNESILIPYLRLFALDIPIFSLAHAHRNILVGLGGFGERAFMSAGRTYNGVWRPQGLANPTAFSDFGARYNHLWGGIRIG